MIEQVYNQYYDTAGNYHWIGVYSGEHIVRKGERMTRDEAITKLKIYRDYLCKMSSMFDINEVAKPINMAIEALEQPTADVVEVVRCKDCARQMICFHSNDYFCADGERIEDDTRNE